MNLRVTTTVPPVALEMLKHCYTFLNGNWQHLLRDNTPDEGFEARLRESFVTQRPGWVVSQHREMNLGGGYTTTSGVLHEIDIVVQHDPVVGIMELKNRATWPPNKNDVIVFFSKILDYICYSPTLLRSSIVPAFVSSYAFDRSALAACLGLGIHPIAPQLRPVPMLVDNAKRMAFELRGGLKVPLAAEGDFDDFCSQLNRMMLLLDGAEVNMRMSYLNDSTLAVHAFGDVPVMDLADELQSLNGECSRLLTIFRAARGN